MTENHQKSEFDNNIGRLNVDLFPDRWGLCILLFLILAIGIYGYREYLGFEKAYVFLGFVSDTFAQFFPEYFFRIDKILSGNFPFWSFQLDLGMNSYPLIGNFNPFDMLLLLAGKENIVYVLPYIVIFKFVIAGSLFYGFLRKLKICVHAALIGSLIFTYSGYMVLNGQWYYYQNYAVFAALMLFLFERWFQNGKWLCLVLAIGLIFLKGVLQLYQLVFFLTIYGLFRIIIEHGFKPKESAVFCAKSVLLYVIGLGIGAFYLLPSVFNIVSSARGGSSLEKFSMMQHLSHVFRLSGLEDYATVLFRYFSNDLLGSYEHFRGMTNYLEAPAAYVGLITLIVIPLIFVRRTKREKVAFSLIIVTCVTYIVLPFVREFGNAFASLTYKHTIMYVSILLIILCSYSLHFIFREGIQQNDVVFAAIAVIIAVLIGSRMSLGLSHARLLDNEVFFTIIKFLLIYGGCFFLIYRFGPKQTIKNIILVVVLVELALFTRTTMLRNNSSLKPGFIKKGEWYFNKNTINALKYIKTIDKGFYRIEKDYHSGSLNDAMIQNYYGTSAYLGFSNNHIVDFHKTMKLSQQSPRIASYRYGLGNRNKLHALLGVKYYLSHGKCLAPFGFSYLKSFGKVHVFYNRYSLPLGFAFKSFIHRDAFDSLPVDIKDAVILRSFVTDKSYPGLGKLDIKGIRFSDREVKIREDAAIVKNLNILSGSVFNGLEYFSKNNDPQIVISLRNVSLDDSLIIKLELESTKRSWGQLFWKEKTFREENSSKFIIWPGRKIYSLTLRGSCMSSIRLDIGNKAKEHFKIHSITFRTAKLNGTDLAENIDMLRQEAFQIKEFLDDHIKGSIDIKGDRMVFFSIPYDKGWKAKVNGNPVRPLNIDIGFIGIPLEKGVYEIELNYVPPYFYLGLMISIISLFFVFILYLKLPAMRTFKHTQQVN